VDLFLSSFISSIFLSLSTKSSFSRPATQAKSLHQRRKSLQEGLCILCLVGLWCIKDEKQSKKPSIQGQSPPVEEKLGSRPLGCSKFLRPIVSCVNFQAHASINTGHCWADFDEVAITVARYMSTRSTNMGLMALLARLLHFPPHANPIIVSL
jgi:hypothetical protein